MKVCIICQKSENEATMKYKVREDKIIEIIRNIKRSMGVAKNNELYVCSDDIDKYRERRKKFEKDAILFGTISVGIVFVLGILPMISGNINLLLLLIAITIGAIFFSLSVLSRYVPGIEGDTNGGKPAKK